MFIDHYAYTYVHHLGSTHVYRSLRIHICTPPGQYTCLYITTAYTYVHPPGQYTCLYITTHTHMYTTWAVHMFIHHYAYTYVHHLGSTHVYTSLQHTHMYTTWAVHMFIHHYAYTYVHHLGSTHVYTSLRIHICTPPGQ